MSGDTIASGSRTYWSRPHSGVIAGLPEIRYKQEMAMSVLALIVGAAMTRTFGREKE